MANHPPFVSNSGINENAPICVNAQGNAVPKNAGIPILTSLLNALDATTLLASS